MKIRLSPSGPLFDGKVNGNVPIWDATLQEWIPGPQSGGGGGGQLVARVFLSDLPFAITADTGGWIPVPHGPGESAVFDGFAEPGWTFDASLGTITWGGPEIAAVQVVMQLGAQPPGGQNIAFGVGFANVGAPEEPSYDGLGSARNMNMVQVEYFNLGAGAELRGFLNGDPPVSGTDLQIKRYTLDVLLLGLS